MLNPVESVKRWQIRPRIPSHVSAGLHEYHPVVAQCLFNRGQDTLDKIRLFIEGGDEALNNAFNLDGMGKAIGRIRRAIQRGEAIAVYGDFDADGVTSTVLLVQTLEALGGKVQPYIPDRVDEGYGLNKEALSRLYKDGVRLVITVDCGIRSVEEVAHGQSIGLDMIVTDHHSVGEGLPPAHAVINPKIDAKNRLELGRKNGYPEDMLAGVGVAYKLAEALINATQQQSRRPVNLKLEDLLDLVALGTVADLAPLDRLENRELVRRGLEVLNRAQRPGIYELLQVARIEPGTINATSIGYMLGPRINAAGRLGSAMIAYELLSTRDITRANQLAQQLQELNQQRQSLTLEAVEVARARAFEHAPQDSPLIFAVDASIKSGIVGLVAGRLCEEFYRPAVVIEEGAEASRGSCRSIPEFDITHALDQCADLLVRHGGHAQAAGFTVLNENLPLLRERLLALAEDALRGQELRPALEIDAEVPFDTLTMDLAGMLQRLEPCGFKNDSPLLVTRRLYVQECKRVGQEGKHLRLRLSNGLSQIDGIGFKLGDWADHIPPYIDAAYHLEINQWNGYQRLQLNIQDLHPSGERD